jgi:hypothetical protein
MMVGMTVADEPAKDTLQGSWNDYPAKWIGNSEIPTVTPGPDDPVPPSADYPPEQPQTPVPPAQWFPPQTPPGGYPPGLIPPRQQQQGKPSGGGFAWNGGKTGGGSFGGKQGGGSSWGKTKPPQSQQGAYPRPGGGQADPSQAQLIEYIRALQAQNAQLRALLERLAGQQGMNGERSPDMPSSGVPLQ